MVLFVTGLCRFRCFYCPVSERRNQKDVTYANERLVRSDEDVLDEARAMGAGGTGITGGDPLGCIDRTVHYVELLKGAFGPSHHIHLYTHEPNPEKLARLARAGLDEFRLHIPHYVWDRLTTSGSAYRKVLAEAPSWGLRRGVEIPVLPDKERALRRLLRSLGRLDLDFVNLNELEFSETNEEGLRGRGYRGDPRNGWGVRGSRALAQRLVAEGNWKVPVHYCSSRFKDGVQLRERLKRRAQRTAPAFCTITPDGTLVKGIIELDTVGGGPWAGGAVPGPGPGAGTRGLPRGCGSAAAGARARAPAPGRPPGPFPGLRRGGIPHGGCAGGGEDALEPRGLPRGDRNRRAVAFVAGMAPECDVADVPPLVLDGAWTPPPILLDVPEGTVPAEEGWKLAPRGLRGGRGHDGRPGLVAGAHPVGAMVPHDRSPPVRAASQLRTVLAMISATVTGPTPPGTGV